MRFPNRRLALLFDILQQECLPQDELARRLNVSTRTVRADLAALNTLLADWGARFLLIRGEGYRLEVFDPTRFAALHQQISHSAVPRTATQRIQALLIRFLTSAYAIKLETLAEQWFVSRATLQNDMAEVRERLSGYQLTLETRPRYGMKLFGSEAAIRACLTELLCQMLQEETQSPLVETVLDKSFLSVFTTQLHQIMVRNGIRMTDEGEQYLRVYCAIALRRINEGFPLSDFEAGKVDEDVRLAAHAVIALMRSMTEKPISLAEETYLRINIAAWRVQEIAPSTINADDAESLVSYILHYINQHYNYDLRADEQLRADLLTHVKTMITRVRYQINITNPLLDNIKQHYPLAYDVTLSAVVSWSKYTPYAISESEIGYLVLHIGVGLERHYHIGYQRQPHAMLVCDTGNSTVRTIQTLLQRKFPQVVVTQVVSLREYEQRAQIEEDFVIATTRVSEKDKPVVVLSLFPTDYQLEQLGKLVLLDRTRPYILQKFFDPAHFTVVREPLSQQALFERICRQLQQEGYVDEAFYPSVLEREAIVSTLLGDGIALPHSLGLMARKTVVYTVLAPEGIAWGENETAYVIFLLAISKQEYEEAMAMYDLFVTFVRERAMTRLRECTDFDRFRAVAMDCLSRG